MLIDIGLFLESVEFLFDAAVLLLLGFELLTGGDDGLELCGKLVRCNEWMRRERWELTSLEVLVVVGQRLKLLLRGRHCEGCAGVKLR